MDPIEQASPELQRLRGKLDKIEVWLIEHDSLGEVGDERWRHREDVWLSTLKRYERVYDAERRKYESDPKHDQERMTM